MNDLAALNLPPMTTLELQLTGDILSVRLHRPDARNAMNETMLHELVAVFSAIAPLATIRAVVIRGSGGHFCAGGDIKDMANLRVQAAKEGNHSVYVRFNRAFGTMLECVNHAPQTVVVVLEGAVLGGGFGLACVSDVALCLNTAQFGLPETGLGVIPAQIAPFVVQRIGLTHTRRLALLGNRFGAEEALNMGLVHAVFDSTAALDSGLTQTLTHIMRAAPQASRATKNILHRVGTEPLAQLLDSAAVVFAEAVNSAEGAEGTRAFVEKRLPNWVK